MCRNKKTGKYYALRIIKKIKVLRLKQTDHVLSEIRIMAGVDYPFIVLASV